MKTETQYSLSDLGRLAEHSVPLSELTKELHTTDFVLKFSEKEAASSAVRRPKGWVSV